MMKETSQTVSSQSSQQTKNSFNLAHLPDFEETNALHVQLNPVYEPDGENLSNSESSVDVELQNMNEHSSKSEENEKVSLLSVEPEVIEPVVPHAIWVAERALPLWKLIALTLCFLGVQFGWAIQIAYTSPLFLELGVPKVWVSFVWLAGPISGLLVQPTAGVLSDRCTLRWGRRRPFILGGTVFILIGMSMIGNATAIGNAFGDTDNNNSVAIAIAVIGFWVLDLANNTVQGPCRALLVDVAPASQQNLGGSLFSIMLGLGNMLGYFVGSLNLIGWAPLSFFGTNIRALFSIAMFVLIVCSAVTLVVTKEEPITRQRSPTS